MAIRTVADSVVPVSGPHPEAERLERELERLRARFPGAILQRYLDRVPQIAADVHIAPARR